MSGPDRWYYFDYKKNDSIDITEKFSAIQVFISQTEISNGQYKTFLQSLLNDSLYDLYDACKIENKAWLRNDSLNPFFDSLSRLYHTSEMFDKYPVVCINYSSMKEYVNWLNRKEPSKNFIYKLPNLSEWSFAFNSLPEDDSTYSWETPFYCRPNNILLGNFSILDASQLRYDHFTDKLSFFNSSNVGYISIINGPRPIISYNPNARGAYNMSGNVAEIIDIPPLQIGDTTIYWTKGGSWHSPPYYGKKNTWERYLLPSPFVGFRVIKYEIIGELNVNKKL